MKWQVFYHHSVKIKDIPKIPANLRTRIRKAIEARLMVDPVSYGEPLRKSLKGYRKLRVRDYRVIYKVAGDEVVRILIIGHRDDVYARTRGRI